jgi:hypothetical protein
MKNRSALQFVVIIGIANFFADFTYEGARGIVGPFLGSLGASAAIVGLVAGLGELMGYGLRAVSGYFADKSHRHWAFAFVGYTVNLLAVPALAAGRRTTNTTRTPNGERRGSSTATRNQKGSAPACETRIARGPRRCAIAQW